MAPFDVKFNPFINQYAGGVGAVGGQGNPFGGSRAGAVHGGSAIDREMADFQRFIPAFNGTGELRPNNAEANAKLPFLYA